MHLTSTKTKKMGVLYLTLSCPGTGGAVVKIGHSNLWPGSKELKVVDNLLLDVIGLKFSDI